MRNNQGYLKAKQNKEKGVADPVKAEYPHSVHKGRTEQWSTDSTQALGL